MKPKRAYFPLKGLDLSLQSSSQPPLTSPRMKNARPFDVLENKARGGQRAGLILRYPDWLGSISGDISGNLLAYWKMNDNATATPPDAPSSRFADEVAAHHGNLFYCNTEVDYTTSTYYRNSADHTSTNVADSSLTRSLVGDNDHVIHMADHDDFSFGVSDPFSVFFHMAYNVNLERPMFLVSKMLLDNVAATSQVFEYYVGITPDGQLEFVLYESGAQDFATGPYIMIQTPEDYMPDNYDSFEWLTVCAVSRGGTDPSNLELWINGVRIDMIESAQGVYAAMGNTAANFSLGGLQYPHKDYYDASGGPHTLETGKTVAYEGYMDNALLFDIALNEYQIRDLHNNGAGRTAFTEIAPGPAPVVICGDVKVVEL